MYKPISNDKEKSIICKLVEAGNITAGQLFCCSKVNGSCYIDPNCIGVDDYEIAQCHNITSINDCQVRTDVLARRVCDWKGNLFFCLSVDASSKRLDYTRFPDAIKWIVNRNNLGESNATRICDNGKWCMTCGDLFAERYGCSWSNSTAVTISGTQVTVGREPVGQLCEIMPTVTTTVTETITNFNNDRALTTGLATGIPLGALLLAAIVFYYFRHCQNRWCC